MSPKSLYYWDFNSLNSVQLDFYISYIVSKHYERCDLTLIVLNNPTKVMQSDVNVLINIL